MNPFTAMKAKKTLEENIKKCENLNEYLREALKKESVHINSNNICVPGIFNLSLLKIKSETFVRALEKHEVYISTTTACSSLEESTILKALYDDKDINSTSIRISISPYTTLDEVKKFVEYFKETYNDLLLK